MERLTFAAISACILISLTFASSSKGNDTVKRVDLKSGIINSVGQKFVFIRPGSFIMGHSKYKLNVDVMGKRVVNLTEGFYMQTTEVTQSHWRSVMGSTPSSTKGDNHPVENVSWYDVKKFIERLNSREGTSKYRLPTEAEWEYACKAESLEISDEEIEDYAWCAYNSDVETHDVGTKKPNGWGLYDMQGNVSEWCEDWFERHIPSRTVTNPTGPYSGETKVTRGGNFNSGSWVKAEPNDELYSYWRGYPVMPAYRDGDTGFRLVRTK